MQVANAQAVELQEVLAQQGATVVQRCQPQLVGTCFDRHFEHCRPAPQYRPTQADQEPIAVHGQPFDVETVVLPGDVHVRAEVGVVGQHAGKQVVLRITPEAQRASSVLGFANQTGLAFAIGLDGQAGQLPAVAVQRYLCQPFGVAGMVAVGTGILALQSVRAHDPQQAVGHRHAFEVGLVVSRTGQVQQLGQREVTHFPETQGFVARRGQPAQAVDAAGLVAGDPQPVAREGGAREVGLHQRSGRELQAHGIGCSGVGHGGGLVGFRLDEAGARELRRDDTRLSAEHRKALSLQQDLEVVFRFIRCQSSMKPAFSELMRVLSCVSASTQGEHRCKFTSSRGPRTQPICSI